MATAYQSLPVGPDGVEVEFSDRGQGDDVLLLVHAGVFGAWFAQLASQPELDGLRVVEMRRAGYTSGPAPTEHLSIGDHAAHCASVLDELGISGAYLCGHSSSALIGLQLAMDRPDLVRGLVLIEPAPPAFLTGPEEDRIRSDVVRPAIASATAGDVQAAFDIFMAEVGGDGYRDVLDATLGADAHAQMLRDAQFFFTDELMAAREWSITEDDMRRIEAPTLLVHGEYSPARFQLTCATVAGSLPNAGTTGMPAVGHLLPLQNPAGLGRLLTGFVSSQPAGSSRSG